MVSQLTVPRSGHAPILLEKLRGLSAHLTTNIKGQTHALDRVVSMLTRGELGLSHPRRPKGTFLFVGPTGTGKTETTNIFTHYLFEGAKPIRFDMSEYQLQNSVGKLIGEQRDEAGLLGRALRNVHRGTLLFDEIEKAHPLVLDLFLQILDDAHITLATGEILDFRAFYIVCTSNIGSAETMRMESVPFASVQRTILMRVREQLRPELVGRIGEIIVYARLGYTTQREICEAKVASELARLTALGYELRIGPEAIEFLVRQGYHRTLGARPMRSVIERCLQEAIVEDLLIGETGSGLLNVNAEHGKLRLANSPARA